MNKYKYVFFLDFQNIFLVNTMYQLSTVVWNIDSRYQCNCWG